MLSGSKLKDQRLKKVIENIDEYVLIDESRLVRFRREVYDVDFVRFSGEKEQGWKDVFDKHPFLKQERKTGLKQYSSRARGVKKRHDVLFSLTDQLGQNYNDFLSKIKEKIVSEEKKSSFFKSLEVIDLKEENEETNKKIKSSLTNLVNNSSDKWRFFNNDSEDHFSYLSNEETGQTICLDGFVRKGDFNEESLIKKFSVFFNKKKADHKDSRYVLILSAPSVGKKTEHEWANLLVNFFPELCVIVPNVPKLWLDCWESWGKGKWRIGERYAWFDIIGGPGVSGDDDISPFDEKLKNDLKSGEVTIFDLASWAKWKDRFISYFYYPIIDKTQFFRAVRYIEDVIEKLVKDGFSRENIILSGHYDAGALFQAVILKSENKFKGGLFFASFYPDNFLRGQDEIFFPPIRDANGLLLDEKKREWMWRVNESNRNTPIILINNPCSLVLEKPSSFLLASQIDLPRMMKHGYKNFTLKKYRTPKGFLCISGDPILNFLREEMRILPASGSRYDRLRLYSYEMAFIAPLLIVFFFLFYRFFLKRILLK